eukprot:scaffold1102_cov195-Alexandrium_tamarense.AAC.42
MSYGRDSAIIQLSPSREGGASDSDMSVVSNSNDALHTRMSKKQTDIIQSTQPSPSTSISEAKSQHAIIKYGSLLLLVGQMVGLVLLMRYSRTHTNGELYLASTAVFMMEIMKFCLCLSVVFYQKGCTLQSLALEVHQHVCASPDEMLKLCVPSLLYTLKILTTALFSATMLGRQFSATKWCSLVVLTAGVAVVQVSGSGDSHANGNEDRNRFVGLVAVLCASCTSGFSGVYFEKILKGSETTLWVRNIQMGIPSMIIALVTVFLGDSEEVSRKGFFVGYSPLVITVITVQAVGGLIVAVVVKYADNVLKVFASSFSILFSCIISAFAFDFRPNVLFLVGAFLVILSTAMYSKPEKKGGGTKRGSLLPISHGVRKTSLVI